MQCLGGLLCSLPVGPDLAGVDVVHVDGASGAVRVAVAHGPVLSVWTLRAGEEGTSARRGGESSRALGSGGLELLCRLRAPDSSRNRKAAKKQPGRSPQRLLACRFSPSGAAVVACADDGRVALWDVASQTCKELRTKHDDAAYGCCFVCEMRFLTYGAGGCVLVWEAGARAEGACVLARVPHDSSVLAVAPVACEDLASLRFVAGTSGGELFVWNVSLPSQGQDEELDDDVARDLDLDLKSAELAPGACAVRLVHRMRADAASADGVRDVSVTRSGSRLCAASMDGSVYVWNALPLRGDCASLSDGADGSAPAEQEEGPLMASSQYISMDAAEQELVGSGVEVAETEEERLCREEMEAALLEYRFDDTDHAEADLARPRPRTAGTQAPAAANVVARGERGLDLELKAKLRHADSCTCAQLSAPLGDDAIVFSSSQDCTVRASCTETGQPLFQLNVGAPVRNLRVVALRPWSGPDGRSPEVSRHVLLGCSGDGDVLAFEAFGLVELQALGEFAASAGKVSRAAYWQRSTRKAALQRGLCVMGLDRESRARRGEENAEENVGRDVERGEEGGHEGADEAVHQELNRLLCRRVEADAAVRGRAELRVLAHGAPADPFLRTLAGRRDEVKRQDLGERMLANMARFHVTPALVCEALLRSPFRYEEVLALLALSATDFRRRTTRQLEDLFALIRQDAGGLELFLLSCGLTSLAPVACNAYGGDYSIGVTTDGSAEPIYYAYMAHDEAAVSVASGLFLPQPASPRLAAERSRAAAGAGATSPSSPLTPLPDVVPSVPLAVAVSGGSALPKVAPAKKGGTPCNNRECGQRSEQQHGLTIGPMPIRTASGHIEPKAATHRPPQRAPPLEKVPQKEARGGPAQDLSSLVISSSSTASSSMARIPGPPAEAQNALSKSRLSPKKKTTKLVPKAHHDTSDLFISS